VTAQDGVRLDALHERAVEAASARDRRYFEENPGVSAWLRVAIPHELCPPYRGCETAEWTYVVEIGSGVRIRRHVPGVRV